MLTLEVDGEEVFAFDYATALLGWTTDQERATHIGRCDRTIRRARKGQFGTPFMESVMTALRKHENKLRRRGVSVKTSTFFEV